MAATTRGGMGTQVEENGAPAAEDAERAAVPAKDFREEVFRDGILAGKTAFVTGGGSGIGAGIARRLARQGARVGLLGRTAAKLEAVASSIRDAGGEAQVFP